MTDSLTPQGDILDENYWMKIQGDVNKCGDRFLELYRDYKHHNILNTTAMQRCGDSMQLISAQYRDVVFAVNVTIFYDGLQASEDKSVFHWNINNFYNNMPETLMVVVERLRYINTKFVERQNTISGQLRGKNIAFKGIGNN